MKQFEIEQKFKIKTPALLRKKLKKLGAKKIRSGKETDEFFDSGVSLRKHGCILRLRQTGPGQIFLTFKGPRFPGPYKKRIESEISTNDYPNTKRLLELLGYKVITGYSKQRETYALKEATVTLDFLKPFGWYCEIEGDRREIAKVRTRLGIDETSLERRSYLQILRGIQDRYAE